jgi:hypothetical protein
MEPACLGSLPPEILLHIAESAEQGSLCSFTRAAKYLYFLLWPVLYRKEIGRDNPVGFIRCIRTGSVTAVSKFIAAGADVNVRVNMGSDLEEFTGYTYPLATAAVRRQKEIVELLLQNGADVLAKIEGLLSWTVLADGHHPWAGVLPNTPLSVAVTLGHNDIAIDFVRKLANPDSIVTPGAYTEYTALTQAALCLRPKVVRLLLERGANLNKQRPRPHGLILHHLLDDYSLRRYISCMEDGEDLYMQVILLLLQYGADPFVKRICSHLTTVQIDGAECRNGCNLEACSIGVLSPYPRVRQHFKALQHRQKCKKLACQGSRYQYALGSEDIPGHCQVDPGAGQG